MRRRSQLLCGLSGECNCRCFIFVGRRRLRRDDSCQLPAVRHLLRLLFAPLLAWQAPMPPISTTYYRLGWFARSPSDNDTDTLVLIVLDRSAVNTVYLPADACGNPSVSGRGGGAANEREGVSLPPGAVDWRSAVLEASWQSRARGARDASVPFSVLRPSSSRVFRLVQIDTPVPVALFSCNRDWLCQLLVFLLLIARSPRPPPTRTWRRELVWTF